MACVATIGGRVPGFWLQEVVEHVYGVGFIRRSLDLHRFERGGMDSLGYDLRHNGKIATVIHGSYVIPWGSDLKASMGTMDMCYACMNLLYCIEMFV